MRVLMLESHPGVANDAVAQLSGAGHTIVHCDTADRRAPCRGLSPGGECPLDQHVDVAVVVQEIGTDHVEYGAICAARSRVPVVELDPGDAGPRFSTALWRTAAPSNLLDETTRAAHDGYPHVEAVARRLVALGVVAPFELEGSPPTIGISVERGMNRLVLTIEIDESMSFREVEITRAATQALRDFDQRAGVIDVIARRRADG